MELTGYIVPQNRVSDDEGDDSEDDNGEQPEFLDVAEIDQVHSGGHLFRSTVSFCKVGLQTFNGKVYQVEGRFPLVDPWWEVTCSVVKRGRPRFVKGFPSYKLRTDPGREDWISIVSLFLKKCGVEEQYVSQLFEWLPKNKNINLRQLMDVLEEFSKGGKADEARMIMTRVSASVAWKQVQALDQYPGVSKYLPKLLPRQFTVLLGMERKGPTLPATQAGNHTQQCDGCQEEDVNSDLLGKLERIITEDVWMLGFNNLVYKELKLVRCEAQLKAFKECSLLEKIPTLQRHSLMAYNELKKHCFSTGSTFMDREGLCEILTRDKIMSDEQAWNAIHFLKKQSVVILDSYAGICKVVIQKFDSYETGIAKCLKYLLDQGPWTIPVNPVEVLQAAAEERQQQKILSSKEATTDQSAEDGQSVSVSTNIPDLPTSGEASSLVQLDQNLPSINSSPIKLDEEHIRAAKMICANPVTVISGKAGCGKTTVVSQLFRAAVRDTQEAFPDCENDTAASPLSEVEDENRAIQSEKEILLTAPTGRAASLLSKKTNFKAYTLHRVLFSFMNLKKNKKDPEQWVFKNVRVLVVDEGSMVPVQLLHSVLKLLLENASLRKFVILGDFRQLPSIEPGNVLTDLYDTLRRVGWAIDMRTNHRAESQLIIENASLIADMGMKRLGNLKLNYDAIVDLAWPHTELTPDKKFILIRLSEKGPDDDLQRAVKFLIEQAPGLKDHATSQFIAFKRDDVSLINELCCKHYSNHTTRNHKNRLNFQPGDKVCCTRNGRVEEVGNKNDQSQTDKTQNLESESESSLRLCNGEIFFIKDDVTIVDAKGRCRYLTLDDADGRVFTVDFRDLQKECKLQHAWARTIHTYQGSENETIVYIVGNSGAQRWKHIYTAVTRGQKRVYVVSKEDKIESIIKSREIPRNTRLGGLVKEYVVQGQELVGTPQAHPNTPKGTSPGCSGQRATPLRTQTPGRPPYSCTMSTSIQPKRLWETADEDAAEPSGGDGVGSSPASKAMEGSKEADGGTMSAGHKRQMPLSAEHEEVPRKQTHTGGC